jgi:signal transduction histidine kinase/DNA-binding response OmpR family regulator/ligand-binding sensor domain-containing protein
MKSTLYKTLVSNFFSVIVLLFFISFSSLAQDRRVIFEHYTVKEGLINNLVEYACVDGEGFAWFAFITGLQHFDGYNFRSYLPDPNDSTSIAGNFITTIFEDSDGDLWFGTLLQGVDMLDKETETFEHYKYNPNFSSTLSNNIIPRGQRSIIQDKYGHIWVNTENGINKIDKSTKKVDRYFGDFKGEMIYDEAGHTLWLAHKELKKFDIENNRITYYEIPTEVKGEDVLVNTILTDKGGLIWLGTNEGVFLYSKSENTFFRLPQFLEINNNSNQGDYEWSFGSVASIYEDYLGTIWFGIGKSAYRLNKYDGSYKIYCHEIDNLNSLRDETVTGIYGNKNGILWISYLNKGISKINIKTKQFNTYAHNPNDPGSISGNTVRSVFKDEKGHLWIGTYNNGLNRIIQSEKRSIFKYRHDPEKNNTLSSDYITAIYVDRNDRLWVGSYEKGLSYADNIYQSTELDFSRFLPQDILEIHEFTEDKFGKIWISTQFGFYIYDPETDIFSQYGDKENQLRELNNLNIQSVIIQNPNIFWMATWNQGLCRLLINSDSLLSPEIGKDSIIFYDLLENISNPSVDIGYITIYRDLKENIWLGSNGNGLIKVVQVPSELRFIKYDKTMGAPGNSVYGIAGDDEDNIWISTNYGIGKFNPDTELFQNFFESDGLLSNVFIWDASFQYRDGEIFFGSVNGLNSFYPDSIKDFNSKPKIYISNLIIHNKEVGVREKISGRMILDKNIRYTRHITLTHNEPVFSLEFIALDNFNTDQIQYKYMLDGFDEDWTNTTSERRFVSYTNLNPGEYIFKVKSTNSDGIWNSEESKLEITILPPVWKTWWAYAAYIFIFLILLYLLQLQIISITRLRHSLQLEQLRHERDNELSQMKINFFTNLSHEIRTPLTLILGPIERILKSNEGGGKVQQQLRMINKNAKRLLRLTNQLLNYKNMKFDTLRLNSANGNIVKFTKEIVIAFKQQAQIKNIDLGYSGKDEKIELWYDRDKLEIVLYNILSNAFKFTQEGGHIQVSVSKNELNNLNEENDKDFNHASYGKLPDLCTEWVEISIKDSGPGISFKHINNIFQRYFQINQDDKDNESGFGIGLEQAKNIIVAHSGIIKIVSKEGFGSEFIVYLPIGKDHLKVKNSEHVDHYQLPEETFQMDTEPDKKDILLNNEEEKKGEILIIDDNPDIIKYLNQVLQADYRILVAFDGNSGYDLAIEKIPDLIISDVMMPGMDGLELCRRLKSDIKTSHIPIFLLTARTSLLYQLEGYEMGADDYITKPFNEKTLKVRIRNVLNTRKKLSERFKREHVLRPRDIAVTTPDEKFLEKLMDIIEENISDPEFNVEKLSREMGMSHSLIYKKLIALTDLNIVEFIRSVRLNCAAQLLSRSKMMVSEVCVEVGFTDAKYFSKCFQKQFNKTPTEFIAEYHN